MAYKILCEWCNRDDCMEKGGSVPQCPIDHEVPPENNPENIVRDILHNDEI